MGGFADIMVNYAVHSDGIYMKRAVFCERDFPFHFHKEWSLGWIEQGSEAFSADGIWQHLHAGMIMLIPPYSVHANKGIGNQPWAYRAVYLNEDLCRYVFQGTGILYETALQMPYYVSGSAEALALYKQLTDVLQDAVSFQTVLKALLSVLIKDSEAHLPSGLKRDSLYIEMVEWLHQHYRDKITLEDLSRRFACDKFKVLRRFKAGTGLSPQDYVTALRIEQAKQQLLQNESISQIAFDAGFYDQSHFTNYFKRYVGLAPQQYRNSCNILQDKAISIF